MEWIHCERLAYCQETIYRLGEAECLHFRRNIYQSLQNLNLMKKLSRRLTCMVNAVGIIGIQ